MMKRMMGLGVLVLALGACDEGGDKGGADGKAAATGAATAAVSDDALDKADDIPVAEDFEDDAFSAVNEDNVEEQVAALEKEIDAD
jgi:hypothetical protein